MKKSNLNKVLHICSFCVFVIAPIFSDMSNIQTKELNYMIKINENSSSCIEISNNENEKFNIKTEYIDVGEGYKEIRTNIQAKQEKKSYLKMFFSFVFRKILYDKWCSNSTDEFLSRHHLDTFDSFYKNYIEKLFQNHYRRKKKNKKKKKTLTKRLKIK